MLFLRLCGFTLYISLTTLASAQTVTLSSSVEQAGRQAACPGEEVTFTCNVTESGGVQWIAEPFITQSDPVTFTIIDDSGDVEDRTSEIHILLQEVSPASDPRLRNFVSILTVRNSAALDGTLIHCNGGVPNITADKRHIIATPPSPPQSLAITDTVYGINDFTVSVEWESPASDGGVGIDSYTLTGAGITAPLTVPSNEPLTATLTLSYNEVHMVSITASNCAGESTESLVTIREGDCGVPASPTNGTVVYTTTTEGSLATFQCSAGLVPGEVMTAVCEESGGGAHWSPNPGDLSCNTATPQVSPTVDCGVPASPTNGTVNYTTTTEGSLATFQCSAGLVPGEVMTAVCEESGGVARWSPNPGDLSCSALPPQAVADTTGLSTAAAVGITAVLSAIVSFTVGLLVAFAIAYCYCSTQREKVRSDSPSNGQQVAPVYEDVSAVAVKDIELKENVAYRTVVL